MIRKLSTAITLTVILFIGGSLITFVGFFYGKDIAITASRPEGASGWTTSQEFITSCTYFPVVIGISLIILSILFATVLFSHWINKSN